MTTKLRFLLAVFALAAIAALFFMPGASSAQKQNPLIQTVKDIAAALQNNNEKAAKKMAAAAAADPKQIDEISDLMHMYRPKAKGGLELEKLLKKPAVKDAKEIGNLAAAMAELTLAKGWPKDSGTKTKKAWKEIADEMRVASLELAGADNPKYVAVAAAKINNACLRCHSIFKE